MVVLGYILLFLLAVTHMACVAFFLASFWMSNRVLARPLLAVASLQLICVALTAASLQQVLRQLWIFDLNPFDSIVQLMLNGLIPLTMTGVGIAFVRGQRSGTVRSFLPGIMTFLAAMSGWLWLGLYVFVTVLGDDLGEYVWWL